jgi:hypothetical protein
MADTIVDAAPAEPVPPTQRDPEARADPPAPEAPAPKPKRLRRLLVVGLVSLFVLAGGAVALWFFLLRYEPTARAHVPAGTNIAIRIEAADVALFGPVRDHLLPLALDEGPGASAPSPKEKKRAANIQERTGVRLPLDVREVVVASMDGKSWVALFGGRIEPGRFVAGLAEIAKDEGWAGYRREAELLVGPKIVIGQADDGTIIVGTDRSIVEASLPATLEGASIGLPEKGALTFVIRKQAFEAASSMNPLAGNTSALGRVSRGTGSLTLGKAPELVVRLEPIEASDTAAVAESARSFLSQLGLLLLLAPDVAGEKEALRAASVESAGAVVVLRAPWPYEGLDRGAARLAAKMREARRDADEAGSPKTP